MKRPFRSALILFVALTLTAVPSLADEHPPGEISEKKRRTDKISGGYAHLLTIIALPGNHDPEEVATRNAKLFEDMTITPQQGEVLASVASQSRDYVRLSNPEFQTAEPEPLPPITPYDQVRLRPLSASDQFYVLERMLEFQDRIDLLETQLPVPLFPMV